MAGYTPAVLTMILLGVTGGIGMGKTTAASLLAGQGVAVVDTDQIARDVVRPGSPALGEIESAFGREVLQADGSLRRDAMARVVFGDPTKRRRLEAILHPRIRDSWRATAEEWRRDGTNWGAVIIPLLFETGAEKDVDVVVCLACTTATQRQRLRDRGWTPEELERREAAQWPVQRKMDLARFVLGADPHENGIGSRILAKINDRTVTDFIDSPRTFWPAS